MKVGTRVVSICDKRLRRLKTLWRDCGDHPLHIAWAFGGCVHFSGHWCVIGLRHNYEFVFFFTRVTVGLRAYEYNKLFENKAFSDQLFSWHWRCSAKSLKLLINSVLYWYIQWIEIKSFSIPISLLAKMKTGCFSDFRYQQKWKKAIFSINLW